MGPVLLLLARSAGLTVSDGGAFADLTPRVYTYIPYLPKIEKLENAIVEAAQQNKEFREFLERHNVISHTASGGIRVNLAAFRVITRLLARKSLDKIFVDAPPDYTKTSRTSGGIDLHVGYEMSYQTAQKKGGQYNESISHMIENVEKKATIEAIEESLKEMSGNEHFVKNLTSFADREGARHLKGFITITSVSTRDEGLLQLSLTPSFTRWYAKKHNLSEEKAFYEIFHSLGSDEGRDRIQNKTREFLDDLYYNRWRESVSGEDIYRQQEKLKTEVEKGLKKDVPRLQPNKQNTGLYGPFSDNPVKRNIEMVNKYIESKKPEVDRKWYHYLPGVPLVKGAIILKVSLIC